MEYVKICLQRVSAAAYSAELAIVSGDAEKAKAAMFDAEAWLKVAKSDFIKAMKK